MSKLIKNGRLFYDFPEISYLIEHMQLSANGELMPDPNGDFIVLTIECKQSGEVFVFLPQDYFLKTQIMHGCKS